MFRWLLSKLSPVPKLEMERVKGSCPDDRSKRVQKFDGFTERRGPVWQPSGPAKLVVRKRA